MSHQDWIDAVCDAPDDDAPRLEYAKRLTQHGNVLGEFIRSQCEIAGLNIEDSRHQQLDQRITSLLKTHEQEWLGALWGQVSDWTFTRGFVSSITVDGSRYFARDDGLTLYRSPLKSGELADLLPLLPPTLRTLVLPGNDLGSSGAQALSNARHLKLLTRLDVSGFQPASKPTDWDPYEPNVGSEGARILAVSPLTSRLHELDLSLNRIDDETAVVIAASAHLKGLKRLTIHESADEPYLSGSPSFSEATIASLRASFGDRLTLHMECPRGAFAREERRKPATEL